VLGSGPYVATQCLARAVAEGRSAFTPALAQHECNVLIEVQIAQPDPDQLGNPQTRVEKEAEDRRVTPCLEVAALAGVNDASDFSRGEKWHRLLRHSRRTHLDEGGLLDLLLMLEPAEQLLQAAVVLGHGSCGDRLPRT